MENKKYLLGLDVGTNSVGWALTDENYKIIKKQGKALWGVRLFEEASDASSRRSYRSNRRRLQRRKQRLQLLKELFSAELDKVDKTFLLRLEESRLHNEDRKEKFTYTLFNDINYSDKDFYKENPTIWHLIKNIIETDQKVDIRKIYLACAYLIKYRGHFLYDGELHLSDASTIKDAIIKINQLLVPFIDDENYQFVFVSDDEALGKLINASKKVKGISDLKEAIKEILIPNDSPYSSRELLKQLISAMSGGSINLKKYIKADKDLKTCVSDADFLDKIEEFKAEYPDFVDLFTCIELCKNVNDFLILNKLLAGKNYLYEVMVERYDEHQKQLKKLKEYIDTNCKNRKKEMFGSPISITGKTKDNAINNYSKYIGSATIKGELTSFSTCSRDDFYKFVKEFFGLSKITKSEDINDPYLKEIYILMSEKKLLLRQNSSDNGVFPMQLNKAMIEAILFKQEKYYEFLKHSDEYGTIKDKIVSLLTFKIPYYVGPLYAGNDKEKGKFSWAKVYSNEKIYPWNFGKVVDTDSSAEEFIKRMQNKCTYLKDCYCLPKESILYSEYMVLSELNNSTVNGKHIDFDTKKQLIEDLYYKKKKITKKDLQNWFKAKFGEKNVEISTENGKEINYQASLGSLYDFNQIFGIDFVKNNRDLIENIISDITLFEDKSILKRRLIKKYKLSGDKIEKILKLSYKGWGRFSKKFLSEFDAVDENGELMNTSIIKIMRETNLNLQEIINLEKYHYQSRLTEYNKKIFGVKEYNIESIKESIDESYTSPLMKRALIQSFSVILELENIIKHPINEFYIECARTHDEEKSKNPDKSRYESVTKLIEEAIKLEKQDKEYLKNLKSNLDNLYNKDNRCLRSDKIYLYFSQLGRCLYTGKKISFDDVISANSNCDIDHIYPRALVKDDSLRNNRVLVFSDDNRNKTDKYPYDYPNAIPGYNPFAYFKYLKDIGFINETKYQRLTRREELSEEELQVFINRQLVTTNQSTKALKDILGEYRPDATIVFSKAENVSSLRQKFDLVKCRDANNYHHAHDAYLNVVVGRTLYNYFNKGHFSGLIAKLKAEKKATGVDKILANKFKDSIGQIKHTLYDRFDIMVTTRAYNDNQLFSKESITPAKDVGDDALPLKKGLDIKKYGGYSDLKFGSYMLVESKDKKGNQIITIESIPTMYRNFGNEELNKYFTEKRNLIEPKILIKSLKVNTIIKTKNSKFCITGKTGNAYLIKNLAEANYSYDELKLIRLNEQAYKKLCLDKKIVKNEPVDSYLKNDNEYIISKAKNEKNKEIKITKSDVLKLFVFYALKINSKIYSDYPNLVSISSKIKTFVEDNKYKNLSLTELIICNHELNYLFTCDRVLSDLRLLGLFANSGKLSISKNISNLGCSIVAESVTGFYSKVLWKGK